jgi:hypothetical protein
MKTFDRFKTFDEITQQCAELGVPVDTTDYDFGGNTVLVGQPGSGQVIYDVTTGAFRGTTDLGIEFNNTEPEYDDHDWYQQLLNFFYVEQ